jgi:hypothetical protein
MALDALTVCVAITSFALSIDTFAQDTAPTAHITRAALDRDAGRHCTTKLNTATAVRPVLTALSSMQARSNSRVP